MKAPARSEGEEQGPSVQPAGGGDFWVTSRTNGKRYLVVAVGDGFQCTCRWARYHDTRTDPCAHILAVQGTQRQAGTQSEIRRPEQHAEPQGLKVLNGFEEAEALCGAAVKLAQLYGVDLDDIAQELAINTLQVRERYGFEHVNTIVWRTRDSLTGYNYGPNRYYRDKGVREVSIEAQDEREDGNGDGWVAAFADAAANQDRVDLALSVEQTLKDLPRAEHDVACGLMAGLTGHEIAKQAGLHVTTVSTKKHGLRRAFAWALD